jgi:hypothetical protein
MLRLFPRLFLAAAIVLVAGSASGFSLLGPVDTWQLPAIGYNSPGALGLGDIGGPMNLGEEYRFNVKTIVYGFDPTFLNYFGQRGVDEINKAMAILNALPPVSKMSPDLTEFPLDTRRINYQAQSLNLLDLKSMTLSAMAEEMGLASPERYVWCLRSRITQPTYTNYTVITRNFDPVTWAPTNYVNGILYTYTIIEFPPPNSFADAVEVAPDPLDEFTSVVSAADHLIALTPLGGFLLDSYYPGTFYSGLTRDDVGGLRYIYSKYNYNEESLPTNTLVGFGGAWAPVGLAISNTLVNIALRPGVDKIVFKPGKNDSIFGPFIAITNQYTDTYITNSHRVNQSVLRPINQPDILFAAADLGVGTPSGEPFSWARSTNFVNNAALNTFLGGTTHPGPGTLNGGQVVITFSTDLPYFINQFPNFLSEENPAFVGPQWASFDGTTNAPFVYPQGVTIQQLEQQVLGGAP